MVLRATFLAALALAGYGFAQVAHAQIEFESKQSYRQAIPLTSETKVIIESTLPEAAIVVQRGIAGQVVLDIAGQFVIAGYHGPRESAGARALSPGELAFRVSRNGDTVALSSPEWWFIHHALQIGHLTVTVPDSIALTIRRLSSDELENRR